ncbi:MAG: DNA replication/repair protein RecF [Candidatus Hydrogenedentes bacterium]|nr:DNA replication/repair protein RecF [Candidatus Hydrogenedentota bacterium]
MHLAQLTCENFRGLTSIHFQPTPGLNVLCGRNAQGKTSVLEAILYLATSKSHRTNTEKELVQHGAEGFRLSACVQRNDRAVDVAATWWGGAKRFKVNGVAQTRVSDILGKVNVVLFSPEDVALVKGAAGLRRRFLDMELSQLQPQYLNALQQYRQVLRQRNQVLRERRPDSSLIAVWDTQLAAHGATLMRERGAFLEDLDARARAAYRAIAAEENLNLVYQPDVKAAEPLEDLFRRTHASDIRRGMTTRGPHLDDFEFIIADRPARSFASQGQQKTAALAVKLAELELVKSRIGEYPILMLDEVLAELDERRAEQLQAAIGPEAQCLLTTAHIDARTPLPLADGARFVIEGGRLEAQ